jgi:hypothetical protein
MGLAALGIAATLTSAGVAETSHDVAIKACTVANDGEPVSLVTAVDDGRGGSLVWVADANANLWLCSADKEGKIYAYSPIQGDLLEGAGAHLAEPIEIDDETELPLPGKDPIGVAEQACQAYLPGEPGTVVGSGTDGLAEDWVPGFFVFIETDAGETFLCDATADAQVWAFAEIDEPLSFDTAVG